MKLIRKTKRWLSVLLTLAVALTLLPTAALAEGTGETGLNAVCHTEHDAACGYAAAQEAVPCGHLNEDGAYSCAPEGAGADYVCPHNDGCGYAEAVEGAPCAHACEVCRPKYPVCETAEASSALLDKLLESDAALNEAAQSGMDREGEAFLDLQAENDALYAHVGQCEICAEQMAEGGAYYEAFYGTEEAEGTQITSTLDLSSSEDTSGSGYSWVKSTKTLTLTGIDLSVTTGDGIILPRGSTIVLEDSSTNKVMLAGEINAMRHAITTPAAATDEGGLTISGTGILNAGSATALNYTTTDSGDAYTGAIHVGGKTLKIESGTINLSMTVSGTSTGMAYGIYAGSLEITGGTVTSTATKESGGSASAYGATIIGVSTSVKMTGGSLLLSGTTRAGDFNAQATGYTTLKGSANVATSSTDVTSDVTWNTSQRKYRIGGSDSTTDALALLFTCEAPDYTLYFEGGKLYKHSDSITDPTEYDGNQDKWSASGTTLTLKEGFAFSTTAPVALEFAPTAATLTLEGSSNLTSTYESAAEQGVHGIQAAADLTINGSGSLTVQSGKDTATSDGMSTGLFLTAVDGAPPTLTVDGATVTLNAGSASKGDSVGLALNGNLTLKNSANLTAASTQAVGGTTRGYGSMVTGALTMSDGSTLTAKGGTYAWSGTKINADYTLAASTVFAGTDANGEGVTSEDLGSNGQSRWVYSKNSSFAKYLKINAPAPADYTLIFDSDNKKLYKGSVDAANEYTAADGNGGLWDFTDTNRSPTLILKDGFTFSTTAPVALEIVTAPDHASLSKAITVEGAASIISTAEGETNSYGIKATSSVTINGSGTLTVQSGKVTGNEPDGRSAGIAISSGTNSPRTLTVDVATVNATAGEVNIGKSIGLTLAGALELKNGAKLTAASAPSLGNAAQGYGVLMTGATATFSSSGGSMLTVQGASYAWEGAALGRMAFMSASTDFGGADPTSDDIRYHETTDGGGVIYRYTIGSGEYAQTVKYLKASDAAPIDYGLYFENGKLYKGSTADESKLYTAADGNENKWLGSGTTLTLNGFTFSTTAPVPLTLAANTTVLTVTGTNKLTSTFEGEGGSYGLTSSAANLTINGSGSLTAQSGKDTRSSNGQSVGLWAISNNVTVDGATLNFAAGGARLHAGLACVALTLKNGANVTASDANQDTGGNGGALVNGALTMSGGSTLTVKGSPYAIMVKSPINADYTITASANDRNGSDATSEGVASAQQGSSYIYKVGENNAKYLKVTASGEDPTPPDVPTITVSTQPGDKTVTYGQITGSLTAAGTASNGKDVTYQWYKADNASKANPTAVSGAATASFSIPTDLNAGTYYYFCKLSAEGCVTVDTNVATVTVNRPSSGGGDTPSGGGSSGGGGSGGGGGSTSSNVTVPVTGQDSVKVNASVSGSTASISNIDTSKVGAENRTVTVDLSGLNKTISKVTLPKKSVDAIVQADAEGLELKLSTGTVAFDAKALEAVNAAAAGSDLSLEVKTTSTSSLSSSQKESISDLSNALVLNINMMSDGKVISDFKGGEAAVTVPYELKAGQDPDSVTVYFLASDGTLTAMETTYNARTGTVTFIAPHFSRYVVTSQPSETKPAGWVNPFTDVKSGDWFYEAVKLMNEKGLMSGTSATTFGPSGTTTRGMIVTILYRLEGGPSSSGEGGAFTDVPAGRYYSDAVAWASANGVVTGYSDGRFGPDDLITREQMAAILYRYAGLKGYDTAASGDLSGFADQPSPFAADAMKWAVGKGIVTGKGSGTLDPKGTASRAEAAVMIQRFLEV